MLSYDGKALVTAGNDGTRRAAVFGFDLHRSDLPLRSAFPILIQNILDWAVPSGAVREQQINTETPVELNADPRAEEVTLMKPDGTVITLKPPFNLSPNDTRSPGLYKIEQLIRGKKQTEYLAVSFASPVESRVAVKDSLKLGNRDIKTREGVRVNLELWPFVILAVLALLALEWWVYLRGH